MNLTQEQLAQTLEITQGSLSKIERQTDMHISTLRPLLGSLGWATRNLRGLSRRGANHHRPVRESRDQPRGKRVDPRGIATGGAVSGRGRAKLFFRRLKCFRGSPKIFAGIAARRARFPGGRLSVVIPNKRRNRRDSLTPEKAMPKIFDFEREVRYLCEQFKLFLQR
jgi:transcriptional regulator with XRE-family HTH domain